MYSSNIQGLNFDRGIYPFSPRTYEFDNQLDLCFAEYVYQYNSDDNKYHRIAGTLFSTRYSHLTKYTLYNESGTLIVRTQPSPIHQLVLEDLLDRPYWFHTNQNIDLTVGVIRGSYPPTHWPLYFSEIPYPVSVSSVTVPHSHQMGDIVGLIEALFSSNHNHSISDIHDLVLELSNRSPKNHTHAATDIPALIPYLGTKADLYDSKLVLDQLPDHTHLSRSEEAITNLTQTPSFVMKIFGEYLYISINENEWRRIPLMSF